MLLPTAEWIFLIALLGWFVTRTLLPGWRTLNTDFPNYYLAAVLRSQGNRVDRAYEWI